jgi:polo-like kinase 1
MILNPKTNNFNYIESKKTDKQEISFSHSLTEYPKELQNKVRLLQHFRIYLEDKNNNNVIDKFTNAIKEDPKVKSVDSLKKIINYLYI